MSFYPEFIIESSEEEYDPFSQGCVLLQSTIKAMTFNPYMNNFKRAPGKLQICGVESSCVSDDSDEDESKCSHKQRDEIGTCTRCGHWTSVINVSVHDSTLYRKNMPKSILKDIEKYPISDDTKISANHIYNQIISAGARKNSRSELICFCIYQAIIQSGEVITVQDIAKMTGKPESKVCKGIKYYSSKSNCGYTGVSNYTDPLKYIEYHCKKHNLSDTSISIIQRDYLSLIEKDVEIKEKPLPTVTAALIYCYEVTSGVTIDENMFTENFSLKINTIVAMAEKIFSVQNS